MTEPRGTAPNAPRGPVGLDHLAWEVPTIENLAAAAQLLSEAGALGGASDRAPHARTSEGSPAI